MILKNLSALFYSETYGKFTLKGILSCCCAIPICSRLYLIREYQNPADVCLLCALGTDTAGRRVLAVRITNNPNKGLLSWRFYCSFIYSFLFQILSPAILCSEAEVNERHCRMNGCDLNVDEVAPFSHILDVPGSNLGSYIK
jgi:hypothetical protein